MRDLDQIREKIEIRLEPQQIVLLVVTTVLFSAGLFAGGYYLGQRQAHRPEAAATIAAVDQASAQSQSQVERVAPAAEVAEPALGEVEFMFPSELNSRPARKRVTLDPVRLDEAVVAAEPRAKVEAEAAVEKKADAAVEKKAEPQVEKAVEPPVEKAVEKAEAPVAKRAPAEKAVEAPTPKVAKRDTPTPPPAARDVDPAVDEDAPSPVSRRAVKYTLQVKAARDKSEADELVRSLRKSGFEPHIIMAEVPGKGRFYRVRLGRFDSMEAARTFQRRFKAKSGAADGGFVTEL